MSIGEFRHSHRPCKLSIGDVAAGAAQLGDNGHPSAEHARALPSTCSNNRTVYFVSDKPEDRKHALALLYYIEAAPAFFTKEEPTEHRAVRTVAERWRDQLGLDAHEVLPVPVSATVPRCTKCQKPTHATDSNDDGVCSKCLGPAAVTP